LQNRKILGYKLGVLPIPRKWDYMHSLNR